MVSTQKKGRGGPRGGGDSGGRGGRGPGVLWCSVADILLLTFVVTLATLAVLSALVLVPIVRLRRHLEAAGRNPEQTEAYTIDTGQNDKMGEVTRLQRYGTPLDAEHR